MHEREIYRSTLKKVMIIVFLSGLLLYSLSIGIGSIFERTADGAAIPAGSTIANIDVGGLEYSEAQQLIQAEVSSWKEKPEIIVDTKHEEEEVRIDRKLFTFKIKDTLEQLHREIEQPWYKFFVRHSAVTLPLHVELNPAFEQLEDIWPKTIDIEKTLLAATEQVKHLNEPIVAAAYIESSQLEMVTIAEASVVINASNSLALPKLVHQLDQFELDEGQAFSLVHALGDSTEFGISADELDRLATAVYTAVLGTNFEIIERHSQGQIPAYAQAGLEATVVINEKDLVFQNSSPFSYTLQFSIEDSQLKVAVIGPEQETTYSYDTKNVQELQPRTIYRYDKNLAANRERVADYGSNGYRVDVYRVTYNNHGKKLNETRMARDYYPPSPRIVMLSTEQSIPQAEDDSFENIDRNDDKDSYYDQNGGRDNYDDEETNPPTKGTNRGGNGDQTGETKKKQDKGSSAGNGEEDDTEEENWDWLKDLDGPIKGH
ncbi:VanW family protein [Anaerobacillus sp. MEB173]|uniref:VanW family protein n=1 Tax=Anaerobacillus sp. MEB173 TaxID=3383345 RepID=UPI003F913504